MATERDPLLDDALTLVRTMATDQEGFVAMVAKMDDAEECRRIIVRLAQLVRIATSEDLDLLTSVVAVMQTGQGDWYAQEPS